MTFTQYRRNTTFPTDEGKYSKYTFFNSLPQKTDIQIKEMNEYLGISLSHTNNKYDEFDAIDREKQVLLECKHRTNTHDEYPDTIIGVNKYLASREKYPDWDFYASFLFADGMYYYKFDNTKTLEEQGIFTSTRQYNKMITNGYVKEHLNIPITKLTRVGKIGGDIPADPLPIPKGVCLITL